MSYFPAPPMAKFLFFIFTFSLFLFCRQGSSQDGVDILPSGSNPSFIPRPSHMPCKLDLSGEPRWQHQPQGTSLPVELPASTMAYMASNLSGGAPVIPGSPDMEDLLHEWLKQQINAGEKPNNQSFNQPFSNTGSDLDPKTPGILVFDSDNEGLSFVLTLDERGHLISTDVPGERVELQESLKFEDLGIVWLDSQNKIQMTSDDPIVEDFGSEETIISFIENATRGSVYFKTMADGTRVYFYRGIDGQHYKVIAEQIQQYRQAVYEYEMAKVFGEGLPAGGWIPREAYLDGKPSAPTGPGSVVSIIDDDFEGRQAGRTPSNKKDDPKNDPTRGVKKGGVEKDEIDGLNWGRRLRARAKQDQPEVIRRRQHPPRPPSDNVTPRESNFYGDKGYLESGRFYTEQRPENLQVAQDRSVAAGILDNRVVVYQPVQAQQWGREGNTPDTLVTTMALSPNGNRIAVESGDYVEVWERSRVGDEHNFERVQRRSMMYPSYSPVESLQFSPDSNYLAIMRENGSAELRQVGSRYVQRFPSSVGAITFNTQSDQMVVAEAGTVTLWGLNPASNTAAIIDSVQLSGQVEQLHISPDGSSLVASNGREVWIMTIDSNSLSVRPSRTITLGEYSLDNVAFSTGLAMIVGHTANSVRIWRSGLYDDLERTVYEHDLDLSTRDSQVRRAFYIPQYERVAITFEDNSMEMWLYHEPVTGGYYGQGPVPVTDFGEVVEYPGAGNFLVAPDANHLAVRFWWTE